MLACSTTGHVREERKLVQHDKALSHEVHSNSLAVAAVLAERNTNGVICKSKKHGLCLIKSWARLILKCSSHTKHGFLRNSLSMLPCMMTVEMLQHTSPQVLVQKLYAYKRRQTRERPRCLGVGDESRNQKWPWLGPAFIVDESVAALVTAGMNCQGFIPHLGRIYVLCVLVDHGWVSSLHPM